MQKNYKRMDGIIGEENLKKIDDAINLCITKVFDAQSIPEKSMTRKQKLEVMIPARRYILAQMLEIFGCWQDKGDCIPNGIQLGQNSKYFIETKIILIN